MHAAIEVRDLYKHFRVKERQPGFRAAVAAGVALAPTLSLLVLARRDVVYSFGEPLSLSELSDYVSPGGAGTCRCR